MADMALINKNIRTLVRELLGMAANSVRPANQNGETGTSTDEFATVLVTLINPTGQDDLVRENVELTGDEELDGGLTLSDVRETIIGQRMVMASVNFYRPGAFTKASRLPALLSTSRAIERMQVLGLGLVGTSQPRNLTALVNTRWEERGQIDLTFYAIDSETETVHTYGTFPVEVSTADSSGTTETQAFEVNEP